MTLLQAWDKINENYDDASATSVIATGQNVDENFWDNFIVVCNNEDGLSALLNVPPEKILTWPSIIKMYVKKASTGIEPEKINHKVLPTGDINGKL
jgi:hypothetical protein